MFAVTHFVGDKPNRDNQRMLYESKSGLKVYRNPNARPRAWLVHHAKEGVNDWRTILRADFDSARTVLLPGRRTVPLESCDGGESVVYTSRAPSIQKLSVTASCAAMLVVAETWYPGWRARVDGKSVEILEVNGALRGVPIPKGAHSVEFEYQSDTIRWGGLLTACGCLGAVALFTRSRTE